MIWPELECHESNAKAKNQKPKFKFSHSYSKLFRHSFVDIIWDKVWSMGIFLSHLSDQIAFCTCAGVCLFYSILYSLSHLKCRTLIEQTNESVLCNLRSLQRTNRWIIINLTYLLAFFTCFLWAVINNWWYPCLGSNALRANV